MFDSLSLWGAQLHGQLNRCVDRRSGRASERLKLAFAESHPAERVPSFQHLEIHRLRIAAGIRYRENRLLQPQCAAARFLRTAHPPSRMTTSARLEIACTNAFSDRLLCRFRDDCLKSTPRRGES